MTEKMRLPPSDVVYASAMKHSREIQGRVPAAPIDLLAADTGEVMAVACQVCRNVRVGGFAGGGFQPNDPRRSLTNDRLDAEQCCRCDCGTIAGPLARECPDCASKQAPVREALRAEREEDEADTAAHFDRMLRDVLADWGQTPAGEWPLTLTCGRDGIGYLAFPLDLEDVPQDVSERTDAARWMMANDGAPFGQGKTPEAALVSLREHAARIRADVARSKRALLADGNGVEQIDFDDCVTMCAGLNAAGERVLCVATRDGDESSRYLHALIDESTYTTFRRGETTWKTILEAAPFYLVERGYGEDEESVTEMTWDELGPDDTPTDDSFCPAHAQWAAMEKPQ